ncbi:amylo-alpha-1,6-glucosidase [soil metagenome]
MNDFGRDICGDPQQAASREWLVTNGIGGYASGTISGELTRRYHGLLVAALHPPLGRTLLISKLQETVHYDERVYPLSTNRWTSRKVHPHGYLQIERFRLEGSVPVWTFACADAAIEKRVWMPQRANTVYVRYTILRGSHPLRLVIEPFVNYRDSHDIVSAQQWHMEVTGERDMLTMRASDTAVPFTMSMKDATVECNQNWQRDLFLAVDESRGIVPHEDHLQAGQFSLTLNTGQQSTFIATAETPVEPADAVYDALLERNRNLLERSGFQQEPEPVQQLVLAADQFVVQRPFDGDPEGRSIIAGYHWFEDWGRDTMISLPGLTLVTGRPEVARKILLTFAAAVSQGMLPNRFPEDGSEPVYNTIDASPWFFEAVRAYYSETGDRALIEELFPTLDDMVAWHESGTRYGIQFDPDDGLVRGSVEGAPLTWMDAKMGDFVPTPRVGKPVEISALWYNALCVMDDFAQIIGKDPRRFQDLAGRLRIGFARFWNEEAGYCFDVLDGPDGNDLTLRPNQLLAVSLAHSPLDKSQAKSIVDVCGRTLVTSHGLRSLAPFEDDYLTYYAGTLQQRDAAYHQGTVWSWLIGPFVSAHLHVYGDREAARSYLQPLFLHMRDHGLGSISEVFDAEPPFQARGCIAQAWGVAELLRVWKETMD